MRGAFPSACDWPTARGDRRVPLHRSTFGDPGPYVGCPRAFDHAVVVSARVRVFSYVVRSDSGFAPNPFHGTCTLACCKPDIRRSATVGDLIVGMSKNCVTVVYAMKVDRVLSFADYWNDPASAAKRPDHESPEATRRRGDNIYEPLTHGGFRQLRSLHSSADGEADLAHQMRDLGGKRVLVGSRFAYFGVSGPPLPSDLAFLEIRRGHRCRFTGEQVGAVAEWFAGLPQGVVGPPGIWPSSDSSWIEP